MATRTITRAGVGLVVGIILLAVLVIGILFFVRERGETARRTEAINIADQQLKEESDKEVAANSDADNSSTNKEEQAPAVETPAQTTPQATTPTSPTTPTESNPSELPKTGPAGQVGEVAVLSILGFSVASYILSRKRI